MLRAEEIRVCYDRREAVKNVSLAVEPGQWWMLVGPNGAGKSSLLRALAQSVPYEGQVTLDGQNLREMKPAARARLVGVLAQQNSVQYAYSVEEIVGLGAYAWRRGFLSRPGENTQARIDAALEKTGMAEYRATSVLNLSGGELQRAFLAQVFAQDPRIMLLDEPANHLDLKYQQQLFDLIGNWLKRPDRAVISVVHDLSLAKKYGTHALLMREGVPVAQGEISAVLTAEHLCQVYDMDVSAWMRGMYGLWTE